MIKTVVLDWFSRIRIILYDTTIVLMRHDSIIMKKKFNDNEEAEEYLRDYCNMFLTGKQLSKTLRNSYKQMRNT